jgi:hypothetical protein
MELNRFAKYAWVALAYTLVFIVWVYYFLS